MSRRADSDLRNGNGSTVRGCVLEGVFSYVGAMERLDSCGGRARSARGPAQRVAHAVANRAGALALRPQLQRVATATRWQKRRFAAPHTSAQWRRGHRVRLGVLVLQ